MFGNMEEEVVTFFRLWFTGEVLCVMSLIAVSGIYVGIQ